MRPDAFIERTTSGWLLAWNAMRMEGLSRHRTLVLAALVVSCATWRCQSCAAQDGSAAGTVGKFIIVISPRGWQPYFVRHELIHWLQGERLGVLGLYGRPEWFVEGMAYALSEDPRPHLVEPFQGERAHFQAWYAKVGKAGLWTAPAAP